MFTAYFYARRIQQAERERQEEFRLLLEAERRRQEAEAKLLILKAQLEQANAPRRHNRRRSLR